MTAPGERIGRYELDRLLGRGGMGEVWEASLHGLHGFRRKVALKIVSAETIDDESRGVLIAEARLGAMLHHPNVAGTLELGHHRGHWFIAMELVDGPTVRVLAKQGRLSARTVVEIGLQTCRGLHYIHASELVHRDIKETNLVVDPFGTVKIVDLGVARLRNASSGIGGTPGYMPAEQLLGKETFTADIFALGATLFRLTSGKRPFGRRKEAIQAVLDMDRAIDALELQTTVEPYVPGLADVIRDCLNGDPTRRPDARTLGVRLQSLLPDLGGRTLEEAVAGMQPETPSPPAASSESRMRRGRFPRPATPMIGRADILDGLRSALGPGRVVTLTALGGMGKTRVALATATALDAVLEGGSWFVDLAEAEHADQIRPQIAAQLGLKGHDSQPLESILESSERLVILDNMEQIAGAGADVVQALVRACPSTWFLVTSRLPLGLDDEEVFRLAPLSTTASIELLTERNPALQRADPTLLDALAEALEGSPLAIELAAAQTRTVPAADVLAQIRTHFDAVEDGAGIHPDRHRSLRACLDGSWELLNPSEQQTLAQLSIFVGGFTMEAAEAVVRVDRSWVHDTLAFLVDCSLLHADRSGRFRMLPSTVAYAREHLPVPIRMDVRHRHLAYFAQMGTADALARLDQRGGFPLLERLQEDLDNLLLAASHARAQDAFDLAVDVSLAAAAVLRLRGPHAKAVELLVHVQTVQPVAQRARLFTTLARFGFLAGNAADGARHAALGLQAARATDDPDRVAASLLQVAEGLRTRNELSRAKSTYKEVLTLVPRCRSRLVEAVALEGLASIQHRRGRPEAARSLYNRAVHLYDQRGAEHVRGFALVALCVHLVEVGELERADRLFRRALRSSERTGHRRVYLRALGGLALIADYRGDLETAATMYQRATRESRSFGMARTEASNLLNLGSVYVVQGETRKALKALGETREVLARVGNPDDLDSIALYWLACSCFDRGQFGEAVTHLEEICTRKERSQEPRWNGAARLLLGRVALYAQDPIAARTHLQAADPLVRAANDPALVVQLLLVRAHLCRATRDLTKAEQLLERAGQVPMVAQQPWLAGWSDLERAQICLANAQIAEGVSAAEQAYAHSNDAGYTVQASLALAVLSRALVAAGQVDRSEEVRLEALAVLQPLRAAGSSPLRSTLTQGRPR